MYQELDTVADPLIFMEQGIQPLQAERCLQVVLAWAMQQVH